MTVLIYVDTSKQVGDPEHIKVFANTDAAETGSRKTIPKAWHSNTRFWFGRLVDLDQRAPSGSPPSVGHEPDPQEAASEEK